MANDDQKAGKTVGDQIGSPEEKGLEITSGQLEALKKVAIDLAFIKIQEASDYANAAVCFAAARQVSMNPEPQPLVPTMLEKLEKLMEFHDEKTSSYGLFPRGRILQGVYRATPAQVRAVQQVTRRLFTGQLKVDPVGVDSTAANCHKELMRLAGPGENVISASDVAKVLKVRDSMSILHPDDQRKLEIIKALATNVTAATAICSAGGSVVGGGLWTYRNWNSSFLMSDLPEDWFW